MIEDKTQERYLLTCLDDAYSLLCIWKYGKGYVMRGEVPNISDEAVVLLAKYLHNQTIPSNHWKE